MNRPKANLAPPDTSPTGVQPTIALELLRAEALAALRTTRPLQLFSDPETLAIQKYIIATYRNEVISPFKVPRASRDFLAIREARDAEVYSLLQLYSGIFAPIRRLPPEILSIIFSYAVEMQEDDLLTTNGYCSVPMVLAHTSHAWRQIVLSSPWLWTRLTISDDLFEYPLSPNAVSTHLANSRDRLVDVAITCPTLTCSSTDEARRPFSILKEILQHSHHLRSISFKLELSTMWHLQAAESKKVSFPSLKKLDLGPELRSACGCSRKRYASALDIFENSPSLTSVRLSFGRWLGQLSLPWANLTELTMEEVYGPLHSTLSQMKSLQKLYLITIYEGDVDEENLPEIVLPELNTLGSINSLSLASHYYTLPNLKFLTIHLRFLFDRDCFEYFFVRSGCRLDYLRMDGGCATYLRPSINALLRQQRDLTTLIFGCEKNAENKYVPSIIDTLLDVLEAGTQDELEWTNLKTISWYDPVYDEMPHPVPHNFGTDFFRRFSALESSGTISRCFPNLQTVKLLNLWFEDETLPCVRSSASQSEKLDMTGLLNWRDDAGLSEELVL